MVIPENNVTEVFFIMDVKSYTPILPFHQAAIIGQIYLLVHILSMFIHVQVFRLLKRKKGRPFNKMIFSQQICLAVCSIPPISHGAGMFVYPISDYIGKAGCYILDFLQLYRGLLFNTLSFYMALFRYLNIIHANLLHNRGWTPDVIVNYIIGCQYTIPLLLYILVRGFDEVTDYGGHDLLSCLGRFEVGFLEDIEPSFCLGLKVWSPQGIACRIVGLFYVMTSTNVLELFMLWKIIQSTKSQTVNVKNLLSLSSFERRQKEDGVMFTVNLWQWLFEVTFMGVFIVISTGYFNKSELHLRLIGLYINLLINLVNAFYLLGDNLFLRSVTQVGLVRALFRAFFQSY